MKRLLLLSLVVLLSVSNSFAQGVSINTTNSPPHQSAILDVSSDTSGIIIPRMTMAQRDDITNPAIGLLICQVNNSPGFYYYNGSNWVPIGINVLGINDLVDGGADSSCVFLGFGSGENDDGTDNRNVALGDSSLHHNSTGINNTAIGSGALFSNTSGLKNTASGYKSLYSCLTGEKNTAAGFQSSLFNSTGSSNTVLGFNGDGFNQEGSYNTIVGCEAGRGTSSHSKSGNVLLGYRAGFNETTDNKLYIENSGSSTPLIWGDFANDTVRLNGTLDIAGTYYFPTNDGDSLQVLQTDGHGELSWSSDVGVTEIDDLTDGRSHIYSLFLGTGAGEVDGGEYNVGIGYEAMHRNFSGYNCTAIGYYALRNMDNPIAGFNTAVGYYALWNCDNFKNTAVGSHALKYNVTGTYNTAIGDAAGYLLPNGDSNTFLGCYAGYGSSQWEISGSVFIGYEAGKDESTSNKLYIENTDSSTPLIWGDFANDTVRINGTFDIRDEYHFPDTIGWPGQILEVDTTKGLKWKDQGYQIGDYAQGGIVFWVDNTGHHGLVVALNEQSDGIRWYAGTNGTTRAKTVGPYGGEMNTALIVAGQVAIGDDGADYAAYLCSKLSVNFEGKKYGDWYLPSKRELELLHINFITINSAFYHHGGENLSYDAHWSSTEDDANNAWMHYFVVGGTPNTMSKDQENSVRAIRAF